MESLFQLDHSLFILINHLPHTVLSDNLALFISGIGGFGFIWLVITFIIFIREEERDHLFFYPVLTALASSYVLVEWILKPIIGRIRPDPTFAIIVDHVMNTFSFPSGHAALSTAGAVVLTAYEKKLRWWVYIVAALICLSRIYLGKHFPTDVLGGIVVGWICGQIAIHLHKPYFEKRKKKKSIR